MVEQFIIIIIIDMVTMVINKVKHSFMVIKIVDIILVRLNYIHNFII